MASLRLTAILGAVLLLASAGVQADDSAPRKPREALQAFNDLIGSWRATGTPEGTPAQKRSGFWTETMSWEWQFKGDDGWLTVAFDKGKHFVKGELRYLPDKDHYRLTLLTTAKETHVYEGELKDRGLTLKRDDDVKNETQRLTLTLLHSNRILYQYEVRPQGRPLFKRVYQVGATKEGVPFAQG